MLAPLLDHLPELAARMPRVPLGTWPTPLAPLPLPGPPVLVKREDLSAPGYGGNKVRTLELVLGAARAAGKRRLWATGAYGSNHVLAAAHHAPAAGLAPAALLWPQPPSASARRNVEALLALGVPLALCASVATFPAAALVRRWREPDACVMPPGAATPLGALGHVGAALELADQCAALGLPGVGAIVLACGSNATTAGLLVGTALASHLGHPGARRLPELHAVRVTPRVVTSIHRIAGLAAHTAALLAALGGPTLPTSRAAWAARLVPTSAYLGRGYGHATPHGDAALATFAAHGLALDPTYTAKAAAYLLARSAALPGPVVFWHTKASSPLPRPTAAALAAAPPALRRWLARCPDAP